MPENSGSKIVVEGGDFTGKTTIARVLMSLGLPVRDRSEHISHYMVLGKNIESIRKQVKVSLSDCHASDLVVILAAKNKLTIAKREKRAFLDKYDKKAQRYNELYKKVFSVINPPNVLTLFVDDLNLFEEVSKIVEAYIMLNARTIDLSKPTIEGESKKIFGWGYIGLVELKPTMYSFTHNRYGIVEGTSTLRHRFWGLFSAELNKYVSESFLSNPRGNTIDGNIGMKLNPDYPFISNYLGFVCIKGKEYSIVRYAKELPPIETVWKRYLVGVMKHGLKQVDKHNTRMRERINYEGTLPSDIVRFDWSNPLPNKDECIPDEFAGFYIDTENAKKTARLASLIIDKMLRSKGYELVDICYFMDYEGMLIHSEITPDGMRVRKGGESFDKDLWRTGKDKETILGVWRELYEDLKCQKLG